jgi:hypothetical protein
MVVEALLSSGCISQHEIPRMDERADSCSCDKELAGLRVVICQSCKRSGYFPTKKSLYVV